MANSDEFIKAISVAALNALNSNPPRPCNVGHVSTPITGTLHRYVDSDDEGDKQDSNAMLDNCLGRKRKRDGDPDEWNVIKKQYCDQMFHAFCEGCSQKMVQVKCLMVTRNRWCEDFKLTGVCPECDYKITVDVKIGEYREQEYQKLKKIVYGVLPGFEKRIEELMCAPPGEGGPEYIRALQEEIHSNLLSPLDTPPKPITLEPENKDEEKEVLL